MKKSVPALQIDLRPSRYLLAFILTGHVGALLFVFFLPLPAWMIFFSVIALLLSLRFYWRQQLNGPAVLRWDGLGEWWLTDRAGDESQAELLPASYLHAAVLVLRFRVDKRVQSLVLLPDSADRDLLRRLRVRLKQG